VSSCGVGTACRVLRLTEVGEDDRLGPHERGSHAANAHAAAELQYALASNSVAVQRQPDGEASAGIPQRVPEPAAAKCRLPHLCVRACRARETERAVLRAPALEFHCHRARIERVEGLCAALPCLLRLDDVCAEPDVLRVWRAVLWSELFACAWCGARQPGSSGTARERAVARFQARTSSRKREHLCHAHMHARWACSHHSSTRRPSRVRCMLIIYNTTQKLATSAPGSPPPTACSPSPGAMRSTARGDAPCHAGRSGGSWQPAAASEAASVGLPWRGRATTPPPAAQPKEPATGRLSIMRTSSIAHCAAAEEARSAAGR
jgi:hypothetical protein